MQRKLHSAVRFTEDLILYSSENSLQLSNLSHIYNKNKTEHKEKKEVDLFDLKQLITDTI